jgi:hypothetical protein
MRKVTKKKHRKARTRATARARAKTKARKGGVKHPKFDTTKQKYSQIFGDYFGTILQFSNPAHINKLIGLIENKKKEHSGIRMNNQEQVDNIIKPALNEFLVYANKSVSGLQTALDAFNMTRATLARVSFRTAPTPVTLSANGILKAPVIIPKNVTINDADILIIDGKNKTERQNLILALAEKDNLVEEFISDLKILAGEEEIKMSIPVPPLPYVDLSRPAPMPLQEPAPLPLPAPMPLPAPLPAHPLPSTSPLPRPSSYKAPRTSKSPHKSKSPYSAKSPLPVQALRVRVTTTKNNPNAIRVDPKAVSVINTNRVAQGKNFKKTRRHK